MEATLIQKHAHAIKMMQEWHYMILKFNLKYYPKSQ